MNDVYDHGRPTVGIESWAQMEEYRHIARRIAAAHKGLVLDWGCGLGQVAHLLQQAGAQVTAFDYQPGHDGWVRLKHFPHIRALLTSDPVKLPFDDGSFEAVLSCGVLEHVEHPHLSLQEIRRVLRDDGVLYVHKLPNRYSWVEWAARRLGAYHHGAGPYDRLYNLRDARRLLENAGFDVAEQGRVNMLPITTAARHANPRLLWRGSKLLERIPGLNVLSTDLELVATPNQTPPTAPSPHAPSSSQPAWPSAS